MNDIAVLKNLIQTLPGAVGITDLYGKIIAVNKGAADLLNSGDLNNLSGKCLLDLVDTDSRNRLRSSLEKCILNKSQQSTEIKLNNGNKQQVVKVEVKPQTSANFKPEIVILSFQQIENSIHLQSVQLNNDYFQQIVEISPDFIYLINTDGSIEYANLRARMFFNKTLEELKGKRPEDIFFSEIAKNNRELINFVVRTGKSIKEENFLESAGSILWVEKNLIPLKGPDDAVKYIMGYSRDLTHLKHIELNLREALELNQAMIAASSVGFCVYNADGQAEFVNDAICEFVGGTKKQLLSQNFRKLKSWKDSGMLEMAEKALATLKPVSGIVHVITTFGKEIWFDCRFVPFYRAGELHLLLMAVNVTSWKKAEMFLKVQRDIAVNICRRTDLTSILDIVLRAAINLASLDSGGFYLLNRNTGRYDLMVHIGVSGELVRHISSYREEYSFVDELKKGSSIYIKFTEENTPGIVKKEGLKSLFNVPVKYNNELIGTICLASHTGKNIDEETRLNIEALAAQVAGAIVRIQATEKAKRDESLIRMLYETPGVMHAVSAIDNNEPKCVLCNKEYARFFGKTPNLMKGDNLFGNYLDNKETGYWIRRFYLAKEKRLPETFEFKFNQPGKDVWVLATVNYIEETSYENELFAIMMVDITDRKRAEQLLKQLPEKIFTAQETERAKVARELHDGIGQILASVKLRLYALEDQLPESDSDASQTLARCQLLVEKAIEEIRAIAHNLRPSDLDDLGFIAACRNLCREVEAQGSITVEFHTDKENTSLSKFAELHLFRIVQESLHNCLKHSGATKVGVYYSEKNNIMELTIKDDGCGFEIEKITRSDRPNKGVGILNIYERASLIGASVEIQSAPGKGTAITVRMSLSTELSP